MTLIEEYGDEAIRDPSSLRGAQRRSNPEIHDFFLDCFGLRPRNDDGASKSPL
jgi:hypothetical protein